MIIQILGYMALCVCYLVAAGLALRIIKYVKTGDAKYKWYFGVWRDNYNGRHEK